MSQQVYSPGNPYPAISTTVVGVTFGSRQAAFQQLSVGLIWLIETLACWLSLYMVSLLELLCWAAGLGSYPKSPTVVGTISILNVNIRVTLLLERKGKLIAR